MPQVRNTAERFVGRVIPCTQAVVRTRPLEAHRRWLRARVVESGIESLAKEAELGHASKTTVSRVDGATQW